MEPETIDGVKATYRSGGGETYDVLRKGFLYHVPQVAPDSSNMTLRLKDDTRLMYGTDYEILLYQDNEKTGTGKIVIKGMGDYSGVRTLTFKIVSARQT